MSVKMIMEVEGKALASSPASPGGSHVYYVRYAAGEGDRIYRITWNEDKTKWVNYHGALAVLDIKNRKWIQLEDMCDDLKIQLNSEEWYNYCIDIITKIYSDRVGHE